MTEKAPAGDAVETSNGVDRSYSFTSSPAVPTTNILVPLLENVTSCGTFSCNATEKAPAGDAVETSNVPMMRLPAVSRTAPGSIVNSGAVSPATVAGCDEVRLNEMVAESAAVLSSPAVRVTPPV